MQPSKTCCRIEPRCIFSVVTGSRKFCGPHYGIGNIAVQIAFLSRNEGGSGLRRFFAMWWLLVGPETLSNGLPRGRRTMGGHDRPGSAVGHPAARHGTTGPIRAWGRIRKLLQTKRKRPKCSCWLGLDPGRKQPPHRILRIRAAAYLPGSPREFNAGHRRGIYECFGWLSQGQSS